MPATGPRAGGERRAAPEKESRSNASIAKPAARSRLARGTDHMSDRPLTRRNEESESGNSEERQALNTLAFPRATRSSFVRLGPQRQRPQERLMRDGVPVSHRRLKPPQRLIREPGP